MVIIGLSYFPSGGVKPEVAKSADKIPPPDNFASEGISHLPNSVLSDTLAILIHWQVDEPHPRNQSPIPTYIVHYTLLSDGVK